MQQAIYDREAKKLLKTPRAYARGVAILNGCHPETFNSPFMDAFLTSIFLREKRLRYLETYCKVIASCDNVDKSGLQKILDEYYELLYPEDDSKERFEERASKKMEWWLNREVNIVAGKRGYSLDMK